MTGINPNSDPAVATMLQKLVLNAVIMTLRETDHVAAKAINAALAEIIRSLEAEGQLACANYIREFLAPPPPNFTVIPGGKPQ
jgi:hypothetical protein